MHDITKEDLAGPSNSTSYVSGGSVQFVDIDHPKTMTHALLRACQKQPAQGIQIVDSNAHTASFMSYADLLSAALGIQSGLTRLGLAPGESVILQLDNHRDHFSAFWGCALAGVIPLTIAIPSVSDPTNAVVKKLLGAWELLGKPHLLTGERTRSHLLAVIGGDANILSIESLIGGHIGSINTAHIPGPDDTFFYQLTSGSTGVPKCIRITHRSMVQHAISASLVNGYTSSDITLNWLTMDHVVPMTFHLRDVFVGCKQVHARPEMVLAEPLVWLDLMQLHSITHTWAPNFAYKMLSERIADSPRRLRWDLSALRQCINAGEQVTAAVVNEFLDLVAPFGVLPEVMQPGFGMAESCTMITYARGVRVHSIVRSTLSGILEPAAGHDPRDLVSFVDLGPPVPGVNICIADVETGAIVGERVVGRLLFQGAVVTPGYVRNPSANVTAFGVRENWFDSGDLGFVVDGRLCLTGRTKEMIIINGVHLYCYEIEGIVGAVAGVAPTLVAACSVTGRDTGSEALAVFFVPSSVDGIGDIPSIARAIRSALVLKLGISPFAIVEVARHRFPKTTSGKIQRTQLKAQLECGELLPIVALSKGLSDTTPPDGTYSSARPRSYALERVVTDAWKQALSIDQVGLDDNFFEIGGHSLALHHVLGTLNRDRKDRTLIQVVDLFRYPTVRSLARFLADGTATAGAFVSASRRSASDDPIAIIGMAGRFPKARDTAAFWRNLLNGFDCLTQFADKGASESGHVRCAPVLEDSDMFAASFFGIPAQDAAALDPQQRLFLELSHEALEIAGYGPNGASSNVGVFGGCSVNSYAMMQERRVPGAIDMEFLADVISSDKDYVTTRVSYKLDLTGPSVNVQTACSTSLVAVHMACRSLAAGDCDMALAGATSIRVPQEAGHLYQEGGVLSDDGCCRAFDRRASGMVFGSGGGVILLKRLSYAIRDGDTILGVVKGSAVSNDGALKAGFTAPSVSGQARVLREALADAGIASDDISYIEAHGSGTQLGDPVEFAALADVFEPASPHARPIALGSVKTNVGHLDAASGMAGLIKTVLMLQHGTIVGSRHFESPNPRIELGRFYVPTGLGRTWPGEANGHPRRAGVSAFGFGGTNSHIVLEQAPIPEAVAMPSSPQSSDVLLQLSALTLTALATMRTNLASYLASNPELDLRDVAFTLRVGRRLFPQCRTAVACAADTRAEAAARLILNADDVTVPSSPRPVLFMLGQDSVWSAQDLDAVRHLPAFANAIQKCDALVPFSLLARISGGQEPDNHIKFVVGYTLASVWIAGGVEPAAITGTGNIYELVAAHLADVLTLPEALDLAGRGPMPVPLECRRPARLSFYSSRAGRWIHATTMLDDDHWTRAARDTDYQLPLPDMVQIPVVPHNAAIACARLLLGNVAYDWDDVSSPCSRRHRIPLPTYPFERQRFWHKRSASANRSSSTMGKLSDLRRWSYAPSWQRLPHAMTAELGPRRWLLFSDESAFATQVLEKMAGQTQVTVVVRGQQFARLTASTFSVNIDSRSDYRELVRAIGALPDHIVYMWGLPSSLGEHDLIEETAPFCSLMYLAQALIAEPSCHTRLTVLGVDAHDISGSEMRLEPIGAMLPAACRAIAQECQPHIACKHVDVDRATTTPASILLEALSEDPFIAIAHRGKHRWVQTFTAMPLLSSPAVLRDDGVYLITGGLGSIGMVIATQLARSGSHVRLCLTGRTGIIGAADAARLAEHGADVLVIAADVADAARMREVIKTCLDRFGTIHGVVHAAGLVNGVDAFPTIATFRRRHLDAHLVSKVTGTRVLADVLPDNIDFVALCSSISTVLSGRGLCPYAAANAFMDAFAQSRRRWLSVCWDYWAASAPSNTPAMQTSPRGGVETLYARYGIKAAEGSEMFARALSAVTTGTHQIVVSTGDLLSRLAVAFPSADEGDVAPTLPPAAATEGDPWENVTSSVGAVFSQVLLQNEADAHPVECDDDFFALGGDSLHAIRLVAILRDVFGVVVPIHDVFRFSTPSLLAAHLQSRRPAMEEAPSAVRHRANSSPPPVMLASQFAEAGATPAAKKEQMRHFYDDVTKQLDASEFGAESHFLNYGYVPEAADDESDCHRVNAGSVRLVVEVVGDCPLPYGAALLDVGSGRGGALSVVADRFPGTRLTGLDLSPTAVAFCRQHFLSSATFVEGDAEQLPFGDAQFDAVLNVESSHSYPNVAEFYREALRVLLPGGRLLYTDLFEDVAATRKRLVDAGFVIVLERDITDNVLRSCDAVAKSRIGAFTAAGNDANVLNDFLAVPGSLTYEKMANRTTSYCIFHCQKPVAPSIFIFPGQGGLLSASWRELYCQEPVFRSQMDHCASLLLPHGDLLSGDGSNGDDPLAQARLFAVEFALAKLLSSRGIAPAAVCGHSLGELVAATIAGVFELGDALDLMVARGRMVLKHALPSVMLSIPLSVKEIEPFLLHDRIQVVAINAASQTVVAGEASPVAALEERLNAAGIRLRHLHTNRPFHTTMVARAADALLPIVRGCRRSPPRIPILSTVTGQLLTDSEAVDAQHWHRHLVRPVQFAEAIGAIFSGKIPAASDSRVLLIEVGFGQTLNNLVRKHPLFCTSTHAISSPFGHNDIVFRDQTYSHRHGEKEEDLIVTLAKEKDSPGSPAPPLWLIHPIGGGVFPYRQLSLRLYADRRVYGIAAAAVDNARGHDDVCIESLASRYIAALSKVQNTGYYLLGGWSFGGIVAFEMAQQLRRAGRDVAVVFMIDAPEPGPQWAAAAANDHSAGAFWAMAAEAEAIDNGQFQRVFTSNMIAMSKYCPTPMPAGTRIAYIRAGEKVNGVPHSPEQFWAGMGCHQAPVATVDGAGHFTMMKSPWVDRVADSIRKEIEFAENHCGGEKSRAELVVSERPVLPVEIGLD